MLEGLETILVTASIASEADNPELESRKILLQMDNEREREREKMLSASKGISNFLPDYMQARCPLRALSSRML